MLLQSGKLLSEGIGALAALGLAAGGYAYAAMWPQSQLFGDTLIAPTRPQAIALTFDDGPNPAWTPRLLDILAQKNVKATFFLVGKYAEQEPYLTRYIADAGHLIGNHTWSHPNLALAGKTRIYNELKRTKDTLEYTTGKPVRFFRPPFGARRPYVLGVSRDLGMVPVMWNVMTNDWKEHSEERIAERLSAKMDAVSRHGRAANVVLHDGSHEAQGADRGPSIAAAEMLISRYIGVRRFVPIDSWSV